MFHSHLDQRTLMRRLLLAFVLLLPAVASAGPAAEAMSTPGKPNAGLALEPPNEYRLEPGESQTVKLVLSSQTQSGQLALSLSTSADELELLSPADYQFDLAQNAAPELSLELLPREPGRYYLMLNAQLTPDESTPDGSNADAQAESSAPRQAQHQSLGVVIQVGEPPRKAFKNDNAAPGVVTLPAQETIRSQ